MNCNRHLTGELRQAINSLAGDNTDTKALIAAAKAQIRVIKNSIKEDERLLNAEKKRILKLWSKEQDKSSTDSLQKSKEKPPVVSNNAEELQKTEKPVTDNAKQPEEAEKKEQVGDVVFGKQTT